MSGAVAVDDALTGEYLPRRVVIPYKPRKFQLQMHNDATRFKVLVCHRRFGKTVFAINDGIKRALTCPLPDARVMYCAPYLKQARSICWDYLIRYSKAIPDIEINKAELSVTYPNGSRFTLAGADNVDAHRGIYLDHLICDEFAQMSPRIWGEVFRPALTDREGTGAFIGTPQGRTNGFYDMYQRGLTLPDWKSYLLTVNDTGLIKQSELDSARLEMSEDEYEQEFMCSFDASIKGAYWGTVMARINESGQITNVPHNETLPVHTVCDLGMRDACAWWFFQIVGREIHFIDYKEYMGMGLPAIITELRKLPYSYGEMIAPHDIRVRELGTGVSRHEVALKLGVNFRIARNIGVIDGIDAVRSFLPRCWFDQKKCQYGLDALRSFKCKYDDVKRITSTTPDHDWSSHGADAMRYAAVMYGSGGQIGIFSDLDYSKMNRRAV